MAKLSEREGMTSKEKFVGVTDLRADLNIYVDQLINDGLDQVIVMRNNQPVAVMISYVDWRNLQTATMQEIAAYLAPALSGSDSSPEPEEKS